jgi:hypothetical protein
VDGPPRVWLAHMDIPGLAMSRSLGDTVAHSVGVVSAPELTTVQLGPEHRMLVVASDGLWEFMSNEEVRAAAAAAVRVGRCGVGSAHVHRQTPGWRAHRHSPIRPPPSHGRPPPPARVPPPAQVVAMAAAHGDDPRKAVDALIAEANARWMREEQVIDDTTVIVAFLDPPPRTAPAGSPTAAGAGGGDLSALSSSASGSQLHGQPPPAVGVRIALASSSSSAAAAAGGYGGLTPS